MIENFLTGKMNIGFSQLVDCHNSLMMLYLKACANAITASLTNWS
jgi:hypothetical protein